MLQSALSRLSFSFLPKNTEKFGQRWEIRPVKKGEMHWHACFSCAAHLSRYPSTQTAAISKLVAEAWKKLPPQEVAKWESMACDDRNRYKMEKSLYEGPWHV